PDARAHAGLHSFPTRRSSDLGEEGFPGTLVTRVKYTLTPRDELIVDYEAASDKATPVNLSQHTYWNLHGTTGVGGAEILDHMLTDRKSTRLNSSHVSISYAVF